jgi:hypothetical protein
MTKLHLYITLLVLTALFTQCKDDAVQPARNQLIIVFPHDSIVKVNLVNCIASGDFDPDFGAGGQGANSSDYGLTMYCPSGGNGNINFPNQTGGVSLSVGNNNDTWNASLGTVNLNIVPSFMDLGVTKVTIEFTNVQFTNASNKTETITVSGNVHCN